LRGRIGGEDARKKCSAPGCLLLASSLHASPLQANSRIF
jgi:hypothetical protein